MYGANQEFRINTLKNFHNFSKGIWMDYGIYNQRANTEIDRISKEINDYEEEEIEEEETLDTTNNFQDEENEDGLSFGGIEATPKRQHSYPNDFSIIPTPGTQQSRGIAAKRGIAQSVFTYEQFIHRI